MSQLVGVVADTQTSRSLRTQAMDALLMLMKKRTYSKNSGFMLTSHVLFWLIILLTCLCTQIDWSVYVPVLTDLYIHTHCIIWSVYAPIWIDLFMYFCYTLWGIGREGGGREKVCMEKCWQETCYIYCYFSFDTVIKCCVFLDALLLTLLLVMYHE